MSCLNLRMKKLPTPKRAWKSFTAKLQTKLHKINHKSTIRKPRNRSVGAASLLLPLFSALPPASRRKARRRRAKPSHAPLTLHRSCHGHSGPLRKWKAPVYVDELFREPKGTTEIGHEGDKSKGVMAKGSTEAADEMRELAVVEPPQMRGIDERAEEFIARFRAEMELQERLLGGL